MNLIRSGCVLTLALFAAAHAVHAQEAIPKVEIFGGYSFNTFGNFDGLNGWNASATWNGNDWFGLTADFSGHYGEQTFPIFIRTESKQHSFLFGPRFSRRWERFTLFGHGLLGAARLDASSVANGTTLPDIDDVRFSYALGGGLDLNLSPRFAIRLAQADYQYTRPFGSDRDSFRVGGGVVFRFGSR